MAYRVAYTRAKLNVNLPSQIRALRRRSEITQKELASISGMAQPRISAMEKPGATQFSLETLVRLAAAFKVGLVVHFASYSEMLRWENSFSQDSFRVITLERDTPFQREEEPEELTAEGISRTAGKYSFVIGGNAVELGAEGITLSDASPTGTEAHFARPDQTAELSQSVN